MLTGRVTTGLGQGASFTQVDWARDQFITKLGIDPYPGTLNLILDSPKALAHWAELKTNSDYLVTPPGPDWCDAHCYPVRIDGQMPGAIVFPEVPDYPETQVEIIAALPLREKLSLSDGDLLSVDIARPLSVDAVIFDVDGTLVDSVEAYRVVAELAAAPYGIPITREIVRYALNNNHPTFWELVVPDNRPNQAELIAKLRQEAMRQWPEVLRKHGGLFPGLNKTLENLRSLGMRMAIVTGSRGGSLRPLKETGLINFFEPIITGKDVEKRKPDPEGLLKCLNSLGVEANKAVYVGDTPTDIQAGKAAGMASVAVLSGAGDSALLSAEGPDWIIHSHARLTEILVNDRHPSGVNSKR